jgi:hypothetical protein
MSIRTPWSNHYEMKPYPSFDKSSETSKPTSFYQYYPWQVEDVNTQVYWNVDPTIDNGGTRQECGSPGNLIVP